MGRLRRGSDLALRTLLGIDRPGGAVWLEISKRPAGNVRCYTREYSMSERGL